MNDPAQLSGELPPIPEGCGILPVAENLIHPHAVQPKAVQLQAEQLQVAQPASHQAAHPAATIAPDVIEMNNAAGAPVDALEGHYRRVLARALALASGAMLLTAAVAASLGNDGAIAQNVVSNLFGSLPGPLAVRIVLIAQVLFLSFCGRYVQKLGMLPAAVLLYAYAGFCGLEFSVLVPPAVLASVFLCTSLMYAATALWGWLRGADLSRPVTPVLMIPAGGLILVVVNTALGLPRLAWSLGSMAVVLFAVLEGSYAQQIRDLYQEFDDDNAAGWKASVLGALLLLVSSVNAYLLLVTFLGRFREDERSSESMR